MSHILTLAERWKPITAGLNSLRIATSLGAALLLTCLLCVECIPAGRAASKTEPKDAFFVFRRIVVNVIERGAGSSPRCHQTRVLGIDCCRRHEEDQDPLLHGEGSATELT